jgi:hypothetical protein
MMRLSKIVVIGFVMLTSVVEAASPEDSVLVAGWLKALQQYQASNKPSTVDLILYAGKLQQGLPYVAGQLDKPEVEQLLVTAGGVDCVLLIENAVAAAFTVKSGMPTFDQYKKQLALLRYRNGIVDGFGSRKHYFSEWLLDLVSAGTMTWVRFENTAPLQKITFMSGKPEAYPKMKTGSDKSGILLAEEKINKAGLTYLPKSELSGQIDTLEDGDVIGFVTTIGGLDVSHTAFFIREKGQPTFLHASTKGSVMIEPAGLIPYVSSRKSLSGIIVARFR